MVTSRFFALFSRPDWDFGKMDIPKMSKIDFRRSNLEKLFFLILVIPFFGQAYIVYIVLHIAPCHIGLLRNRHIVSFYCKFHYIYRSLLPPLAQIYSYPFFLCSIILIIYFNFTLLEADTRPRVKTRKEHR